MTNDTPDGSPKRIQLEGHASSEPPEMSAELNVYQVDSIKVEESDSLRYLRLHDGVIQCRNRVLILKRHFGYVEGDWKEITRESLPEESPTTIDQLAETVEQLRTEMVDGIGLVLDRLGPGPGELTQADLDGLR